ncbi:MAG: hypothetical protein HY360_02330 [Verrucomicrobia bacterium]|nr:hypothetical protein [Verrucomicrobiota bacterium]
MIHQTAALLFCLTVSVLAEEPALIHSVEFKEIGPNDKKPQLLGDRFEYWADDLNGQFYALLDATAGTNAPPRSLKITLQLQGASKSIAEITSAGAMTGKANFLVRTAALPAGKYEVSAVLLDPENKASGQPQSFKFARSDKRNPVIKIPTEGIPIQLEDQKILGDVVWPMRVGVPLPINAVMDARQLALFEDGRQAPANFTPMATWCPQGSVKWVHLDFLGRYQGGKPSSYRLKFLPQTSPVQTPLKVEQDEGKIVVDTGAIRFEVGRKKFAGIEAAWFDPTGKGKYDLNRPVIHGAGGSYLQDGRIIRFDAANDSKVQVIVEEQGPAAVTIAATGWYVSGENRVEPLCMFKTRITAYAGQPLVRIRQHTIITFDTRQHRLADVGFHVAVVGSDRFTLGADGTSVAGEIPKESAMFLHQDRHDHFRLVGGGKTSTEGKASDGWFSLTGQGTAVLLVLRDIWQKFPKEVEIGKGGLTVHFWPKHGHRAFKLEDELDIKNIYKHWCFHQGSLLDLNLPNDYYERLRSYPETLWECLPEHALHGNGEGLAIGNEFALWFGKAEEAADSLAAVGRVFQHDPAAMAPPKWNADSGAMGNIAAVDREHFALIEDCFEKGFLSYAKSVERGGDYGMWNYADTHSHWNAAENAAGLHRPWIASHYHQVGNAWQMYYRTGSPDLLRWARANTDHFIHVDTINYASARFSQARNRTEPTFKQHVAGAMYHCKAPTHWGSRDYGMNARDADAGLWGHWVDPDASLWSWYLDGNHRAKDVYDLWSESVRKTGAYLAGVRREANTSLACAISCYQADWDADILPSIHGMGRSLRMDEPLEKQFPGPLWHALWINRYYDQTRDPEYAQHILEWGRNSWEGDAWALGLYALAHELSNDKSYLTPQLERLHRLPGQFFHAPGDSYDWYGPGPGPLGFQWAEMSWGHFLKQLQKAGIHGLQSASHVSTSDPGYPMTGGNFGADYTNSPPSLLVYAFEDKDREFVIQNRLHSFGGSLHAASLIAFAPSGEQIHFTPRVNLKDGQETVVPATISKDGETGLYRIEYRSYEFQAHQITDIPHEAAWLRKGASYRSANTVGYMQPLDLETPVEITLASSAPASPYNARACNFCVEDATGKIISRGSLFYPRPQNSVAFTLDPARHKLPWKLDAVGLFSLQFSGNADAMLMALSPESLSLIGKRLSKNGKSSK